MLKSSTGYDQSLQTVMCAICGMAETLVIVHSVVCAVATGAAMSTSKYGSSSVAAGAVPMSQLSSFAVVAGEPDGNVAFCATAVPATSKVTIRAQTNDLFMMSSPYTLNSPLSARLLFVAGSEVFATVFHFHLLLTHRHV